jgi:hypothetical protein
MTSQNFDVPPELQSFLEPSQAVTKLEPLDSGSHLHLSRSGTVASASSAIRIHSKQKNDKGTTNLMLSCCRSHDPKSKLIVLSGLFGDNGTFFYAGTKECPAMPIIKHVHLQLQLLLCMSTYK